MAIHSPVIHLAHRAAAAGIGVTPADVFDAADYSLSPISAYAEALGDEPARMIDRPFYEIRAAIPPAAFTDLWQSNLAKWPGVPALQLDIAASTALIED